MESFEKFTPAANGAQLLLKNNEFNKFLLYVKDNIRYTRPEERALMCGCLYDVFRLEHLQRQYGDMARNAADDFIEAFLEGGMKRSEVETVLHEWQNPDLEKAYGKNYRQFVGILLAVLLNLKLAGE